MSEAGMQVFDNGSVAVLFGWVWINVYVAANVIIVEQS
jgi:hypothetical protein